MEHRTLGRYQLLELVGTGGMAEVFLAETVGPADFRKTVAIKRILPQLAVDPEFLRLFQNEARMAARFNHPNIVQTFELGEEHSTYFIAMEYVDGPSLRQLCDRALEGRAFLPYQIVLRIIADACEGLAYAHEFVADGRKLKLVHRDVNPDNILLTRAGTAKIADFGVAKAMSAQRLTQVGTIRGKTWYMPPEQLLDEELDCRTDVFSLGITLYEALTGKLPHDSEDEKGAIEATLQKPPIPLLTRRPDLPAELGPIVEKALAKRRVDRYSDCRAFRRELERFLLAHRELVGAHEVAQFISVTLPLPGRVASQPATGAAQAVPDFTAVAEPPPPEEPVDAPVEGEGGEDEGDRRVIFAGRVASVIGALAICGGVGYFGGFFSESPPEGGSPTAVVEQSAAPDAAAPTPVVATQPQPTPDAAAGMDAEVPPDASEAMAVGVAGVDAGPAGRDAGIAPDAEVGIDARVAAPDAGRVVRTDIPWPKKPIPTLTAGPVRGPKAASVILVTTAPCKVLLDGRRAGVTPVKLVGLAAGAHTIMIESEAGLTSLISFKLKPGEEREERLGLGTGSLTFKAPSGTVIELDGVFIGRASPDGVPVLEGDHLVRLKLPGAKKWKSMQVSVGAGQVGIVDPSKAQ